MGTHARRHSSHHTVNLRAIALLLTEIGRRQRAGLLPTSDGRYLHGATDEECGTSLRQHSRG
ncbi:MAG: hypothetical protein A3K19_31180 [Lentisphaerae bacterium RIFOXYB12_FULL_65_16]|nr:MAG: hypothetical protein A3K18_20470 [Lentisphaerae bacterium RIFOXYA12_64_32]OGV88900.1 MAG: hypothetical protein A3K19_31180 [Lentisphaerae bacterium RIFOXYB12_FULL_65_16]